jgi:chemotaxis protein CheD
VTRRLVAKLVGAAQMFQFEGTVEPRRVGARNLQATLAILEQFRIPVISQDTGGSYGRTLIVDAATGRMRVRAVRLEEKVL